MRKYLAILLLATPVFAKANLSQWQRIDKAPTSIAQSITPTKCLLFSLQEAQLKNTLFHLPQGAVLQFPSPDGKMIAFRMEETPCMEPALAAKYPEIKTFTGVALHNKAITAKIDYTYMGFHAMVFDGSNTYIIDPYSNPSTGYYVCYYKKDLAVEEGIRVCSNNDEESNLTNHQAINIQTEPPVVQYKTHGTVRRTYRLAMACTGQYSVKVAGTATPSKAISLSAITTTVNRINGIYEREIGVSLSLIGNNDDVIYLDGSTDPYANSGADFGTNQINLDAVIGTSNYDIGHIIITVGNAIAQLASVCDGGNKAKGVSGQPNPVGASFDIDFVAHEIGHQLGATHTFNANTGSCSGNGDVSSSHEPGSGSSIMGYAGICGTQDNLQPHSDAYFHYKSLDQITDFLAGNGAFCGNTTPANNTPPSVASIQQTYEIPHLTPFELIAPEANDSDHDALTYCWEQWDLGSFGSSFANTVGSGPIFRSFNPSFSRTRVFPTLEKLLVNVTNYLGEKLPETTRILEFKLTVRDIKSGFGTINMSDDKVLLNVTNSSGPFVVNAPNAITDYWQCGSTQTVNWNVANTTNAPVSAANVDIFLSIDGGYTYPYTLAINTPNDGSETITVPNNIYSKGCRVKVKGAGNVFFDISNENFSIFPWSASVGNVSVDEQVSIYPVPAKDVLQIELKTNKQYKASVTNTLGQQVWTGSIHQNASVNVATWAAGVYSLQLIDMATNETMVRKFVVE
ncbi:hypothetical protein CAP35_00715 [Chitinophagaceae bacterium IBVUCB1]|nr:hypothetical protein CAP35_00715 [Chitinophagaceae bacterium IBVUCB1]